MGAVLVTGAAGFIGSNVLRYFSAMRHEVVAIDRLSEDMRWRNLSGVSLADYIDADDFFKSVENSNQRFSCLIHLGACSATTESDARFLMENNFAYSKACFSWCAEHGVPLIYASSAATYGDGRSGYDDNEAALDGLQPLNAYGLSKHLFDLWQLRQTKRPPQVVGMKFFNVYGPYEFHKGHMASVVLHAYEDLTAGRPVSLFRSDNPEYADGGQMRDFVHVHDVVKAIHFFYTHREVQGLFNVGSGLARTFLDLGRSVCAALDIPERIQFIPMPENLRGRYQYFTEAPIGKLRNAGYREPMQSLEDGVRQYVNFLRGGL